MRDKDRRGVDLTKSSRPTEMSAEPGQAASEESAWAPPTSPIRKSNVSSRTGCVTILPTQFTPPTARSSPYNLSGRYTSMIQVKVIRNAVFSRYLVFTFVFRWLTGNSYQLRHQPDSIDLDATLAGLEVEPTSFNNGNQGYASAHVEKVSAHRFPPDRK